MDKVYDALNKELNKRYSPGQQLEYLLPDPDLPYIVLDKRVFQKAGVDEKTAEDEVAALLPAAVASQNPNPPAVIQLIPPTVAPGAFAEAAATGAPCAIHLHAAAACATASCLPPIGAACWPTAMPSTATGT